VTVPAVIIPQIKESFHCQFAFSIFVTPKTIEEKPVILPLKYKMIDHYIYIPVINKWKEVAMQIINPPAVAKPKSKPYVPKIIYLKSY